MNPSTHELMVIKINFIKNPLLYRYRVRFLTNRSDVPEVTYLEFPLKTGTMLFFNTRGKNILKNKNYYYHK